MSLYQRAPFVYGMVYVLNAGLQGAVFAILGLSAVIKSKYLALLLPFAYCIFSASVLELYSQALNAITLIIIDQYYNQVFGRWGILLYDAVLLLIGINLLVLGDRYEDY